MAYLVGCRNLISHFPSGKTVTSLAIISISFAASSPTRFERTTRMSGAMPLVTVIDFDFDLLRKCRFGGIDNSPRNDDKGYIIALTPGIKFLEAGIKLDVYSDVRKTKCTSEMQYVLDRKISLQSSNVWPLATTLSSMA